MQNPPPSPPIIVKLIEPPHDPTGLAAVIFGALGLTGAIVLLAVLLGLALAAAMFWLRRPSTVGDRGSITRDSVSN